MSRSGPTAPLPDFIMWRGPQLDPDEDIGLEQGLAEEPGDLVMGPWVTRMAQSAAKILWIARPGVATSCRLLAEDGSDVLLGTASGPIEGRPELLHVARATGLASAREYGYVVTCGAERAEGRFRTARPAGLRDPFRFLVYSDSQSRPNRHREVVQSIRPEMPFEFLLHLGDYTDDGRNWPLWRPCFFDPARGLLRDVGLYTLRGNHEFDGVLYRAIFDVAPDELGYSFDWGNVHFAVLDSENKGERLARMAEWLDRDLAASGAEWTIVACHRPSFNVGGHGGTWAREEMLPVLAKHGVDLVLSGHSHLYERFRPIGPRGARPTIHVVAGGGGGIVYPASPSPILDANYSGLHYLVFGVHASALEMTVKTPGGDVVDRLSLTKAGGAFPQEIVNAALPAEDAIPLTKIFKVVWGEFDEFPRPGEDYRVALDGSGFPPGARIRIEKSLMSPWTLRTIDFVAERQPVELAVSPPQGVALAATPWNGLFVPPLLVKMSVTFGGDTRSCECVPVRMWPENLRRLAPQCAAANVPAVPDGIVADADRIDWETVPPPHLPSTGATSDFVRIAWRPDGLYGVASVNGWPDNAPADRPWQSDGLAIYIETDNQRRLACGNESYASGLALYPLAEERSEEARVESLFGRIDALAVRATWTRGQDEHHLRFFIPAEELAPAVMRAGTEMGFHFVLRGGGKVIEQFQDTRDLYQVEESPVFWGSLCLAPASQVVASPEGQRS